MITIAIMNQKGGVAKTTTCINLAAQSALKYNTLLIDCDKQANLSSNLGQNSPLTTVRDAFVGNDFEFVNVRKNIDLLPSDEKLVGIDLDIQNKISRETLLKKSLKGRTDKYQYCFIDCPPDISLVTINVLAFADYIIIPVKAAQYSIQGISSMINFVEEIKQALNPDLVILGFVLTHYDERLNVSKKIMNEFKNNGWDIALFDTAIRVNTAIENSQYEKKTIFEYDKTSNGSVDYMKLGKEVQQKIIKIEKNGK